MKTIKMHTWKRDDAAVLVSEFTDTIREDFEDLLNPECDVAIGLDQFANHARTLASFASVAQMRDQVIRGLCLAAEATAATFDLCAERGKARKVAIEGRVFDLAIPPQAMDAGPTEWCNGFFATCASRHSPALERLLRVQRSSLHPDGQRARNNEGALSFVSGLQAVARRESDAGKLLAKWLEGEGRRDGFGLIALAIRLHEGDPKKFNDALEHALIAHRTFWTEPPTPGDFTDDRREHSHSFLAVDPLGLACLAHDRGIPIEVESDYIPAWIVRRQW